MVFFPGGGLTVGSGSPQEYGPKYWMDRESVVLVTINFRLNSFGFFSLGSEIVPGNQGLRDQQLALSWVRDNIAAFGGDPELVTIFGQSAGAYSPSCQRHPGGYHGPFRCSLGPPPSPTHRQHILGWCRLPHRWLRHNGRLLSIVLVVRSGLFSWF